MQEYSFAMSDGVGIRSVPLWPGISVVGVGIRSVPLWPGISVGKAPYHCTR